MVRLSRARFGPFGLLAAIGLLLIAASGNASGSTTLAGSTGPVWVDVAAGASHTCGIQVDGTLWCWGYNGDGQLGLGDTVDRELPTQVGSDSDWASAAPAGSYSCATRSDHSV